MATEYGYRTPHTGDQWPDGWGRSSAENFCKETGWVLIAREVSKPRIVSIRA